MYSLATAGSSGCAELSLVAFSRDDCSCGSQVFSLYGGFSCCGGVGCRYAWVSVVVVPGI